jgi:hypothetical protein
MDAAPRTFAELATDPELGIPVPFACGVASYGVEHAASARTLDGRRVTQCALSRVCGICGASLGRPIAFLGSRAEAGRNAFHFPPCHLDCARNMLAEVAGVDQAVLGQEAAVTDWVLATTAAFEFVRPSLEDADRRPTFQPHHAAELHATP